MDIPIARLGLIRFLDCRRLVLNVQQCRFRPMRFQPFKIGHAPVGINVDMKFE